MNIVKNATLALAMGCAAATFGEYSHAVEYSSPGEYEIAEPSTDVTLAGEINGNVALTLPEDCRVTLSGAVISGTLTIAGDADLWLAGDSDVSSSAASAISCSGALTVGGDGTLSASAAGAKKTGVVSAASLTVAGGTTTLTIKNPAAKNACGVSLSGDYTQTGGALKIVGASGDYKQNGVFLSKKNTKATITGGTLDVTLGGEKSVGLAMDKATVTGSMSGGTLRFAMSGDGAKGVKGDGSFTMTGGALEATLSGGVAEDYFEYEDSDGTTWNYYVTLTSSTKTSGGTSTYNTSSLIENGTYPVMDPSKCYAVKVGTLEISGGTVKVTATGTAGRGLGADSMTLSGGTYDITVSGGPTDVYVESLVESDDLDDATYANGVATCLDSGGAACLKTSSTNSLLTISGGTFNLKATGTAGKLINAAGYLVIGTEGQKTSPADASFSPDISGSTTGSKVYCTAVKQKYYGTLAVATATADIGALTLSAANDSIVKSSSSSRAGGFGGGPGGAQGGPGGGGAPGGGDDNADYSNPKGIKGYSGVTIHGGRLAITTKNDGGEGLESKNGLVINGGVIDLQCYDDCINSGGNLYINGGFIYALATGNDSIDSNGNIYMTGGVVLAFSTAGASEVGIDTDNASGLSISGGHLVAIGGAAGNMVVGSSGTQKTYKNTSASAATYSGKYLSMTGTDTFTVKMPTLSGSISLVCTTEGWTSAKTPSVSASAPSAGSLNFHNSYLSSFTGGGTGDSDDDSDGDTERDDDDDGPIVHASALWPSDGAYDGSAERVYDGWILDDDGALAGVVQVKTSKSGSTGAFTAKATVKDANAKSWNYTKGAGTARGVVTGLLCSTRGAAVPSFGVTLGANGMGGTWGGLEIVGARNGMGTAGDAMKTALESCYKTSWTTCFTNEQGASRLRFVVGAKGSTKITGYVATNLAASATVQAVMGEDALYVPYLATIKKGANVHCANMLLRIPAEDGGLFAADNASFGMLSAAGETATESVGEVEYAESAVSKGGDAFHAVVSVDDLAYPVKFAAKGLPAGLKINASTGEIYGTPTKPGSYTATITVTSVANSKAKATVPLEFAIANYTDALIPVADSYGGYRVGVKVFEPLAGVADGCTVSGLPAGLKFAAKATKDTTYGFGVVPACTIYGVPTKASTNTVYFKRSIKESNALGKVSTVAHTASATFRVSAIDDWAVGAFNGAVLDASGTNVAGLVPSVTVGASGKFSGKVLADGVTYTLSSSAYDAYDEESAAYTATVVCIHSNAEFTNTVAVAAEEVDGSTRGVMEADGWAAWQNLWKKEPWKTAAKPFANRTLTTEDGVTLKFAASGAVAAKYGTHSCSTTLIPAGGGAYETFVFFPPKAGKFDGYGAAVPLLFDGEAFSAGEAEW